jgi:hypothetical protein
MKMANGCQYTNHRGRKVALRRGRQNARARRTRDSRQNAGATFSVPL